jgi:hypothetical protein
MGCGLSPSSRLEAAVLELLGCGGSGKDGRLVAPLFFLGFSSAQDLCEEVRGALVWKFDSLTFPTGATGVFRKLLATLISAKGDVAAPAASSWCAAAGASPEVLLVLCPGLLASGSDA